MMLPVREITYAPDVSKCGLYKGSSTMSLLDHRFPRNKGSYSMTSKWPSRPSKNYSTIKAFQGSRSRRNDNISN